MTKQYVTQPQMNELAALFGYQPGAQQLLLGDVLYIVWERDPEWSW